MSTPERVPAQGLSIAAVERETGVAKDTLRVWERRYGFPTPERDSAGDRVYPQVQVERLHLVRRLLEAGHRPRHIVALELPALQGLLAAMPAAVVPPTTAEWGSSESRSDLEHCLALIGQHDVQELRRTLGQSVVRMGLVRFVTDLMAPLTTAVGDAWMQGRFKVFEEHLFTDCVTGVLRNAIAGIPVPPIPGAPRVLLTTFPNEAHGLGLLMVEALLTLEGCHCLPLGPQTPLGDIVLASQAHRADVVALSFTPTLSANAIVEGLEDLRRQLPPGVAIWTGGECPVLYQRPLHGVVPVRSLASLSAQVEVWRGLRRQTTAPT